MSELNTGSTQNAEKPLFAFWSALENIIRPNLPTVATTSNKNILQSDSIEKLLPRLNGLKSGKKKIK